MVDGSIYNYGQPVKGLVMCQLCFEWVPIKLLHEVEPGVPEDVCQTCSDIEETRLRELKQANKIDDQ